MTTPRRILFITRSLSSAHGGMQLFTSTLVSELSVHTDFRLTVLSFKSSTFLLPLFMIFAAVRGIFFRGETVHLTDAALSPIALVVRLFRPRACLTLTAHGLDVTYPLHVYQFLLRLSLPRFSKIVAVSRATETALLARKVDRAQIVVIPNGIRLPASSAIPRPETPTLLLLGRQIKRKGTIWFLRNVFPDVLRSHPSAVCVIVGDGPELPRIRATVADLFLQNSVRILDEVDDETKDRLYREATLFVMPNVFVPGDMEGFGLVCIEAAARGLPTVAARLEGLQDAVVEGITGNFFFSEDAADACKAIDTALSTPWDRPAMIALCADRYSASTMTSRYVSYVF